MKKQTLIFPLVLALLLVNIPAAQAATVRKVTAGYCLYSKSKWVAAKKVGTKYSAMKSSAKGYRTLAAACRLLLSPSKLSFKNLPQLSSVISDDSQSSEAVGIKAVSGTPPTLSELADADAASVYFTSGVLDHILAGTADSTDCRQFYASPVDGESGGMSSCRMAQTVGESMGNILQSGTDSCYMRRIPDAASSDSSIITLNRGEYPSGGVKAIFNIPPTNARLVKIIPHMNGHADQESIFIRISSDAENLSNAEQYRANLFFCQRGSAAPNSRSQVSISSTNVFKSSQIGTDSEHGGSFSSTVSGKLISADGSLVFDPSAARTADTFYINNGGEQFFKANIVISSDTISTKMYDSRDMTRKAYSVAQYSGSSVADLEFLAGAFKEEFNFDSHSNSTSGGTEYRDTGYRSSPSNDLTPLLDDVDFDADSFYSTEPSAPGTISFSCNTATPDIVLTLNMESDGMQEVRSQCEGARFEGHQFCESDSLHAVQEAFFTHCVSAP